MDTAEEEVTDQELMDAAIDNRFVDLNTAFPAKVESFDSDAQTVDVVPQLNKHLPDGQGNTVDEPLTKISDVPVVFPRCGEFCMTFPIQAGDYVLVVVCQKNIGKWRSSGEQGDPGDPGMFTLDGAVAIPGLFPDAKALSVASADHMILGSDTRPESRIVLRSAGGGVHLGGGDQFVALANLVKSELDSIAAVIASHKHTGVSTGGGVTGTSDTTYTASEVAASNVKAT